LAHWTPEEAARLVLAAIPPHLRHLGLQASGTCKTTVREGVVVFRRLKYLESLDWGSISHNEMDDSFVSETDAMDWPKLVRLKLGHGDRASGLERKMVPSMVLKLMTAPELQYLDLAYFDCARDKGESLASLLKRTCQLKELRLTSCDLEAVSLGAALPISLRKLYIMGVVAEGPIPALFAKPRALRELVDLTIIAAGWTRLDCLAWGRLSGLTKLMCSDHPLKHLESSEEELKVAIVGLPAIRKVEVQCRTPNWNAARFKRAIALLRLDIEVRANGS
jgi:hypothetical protein